MYDAMPISRVKTPKAFARAAPPTSNTANNPGTAVTTMAEPGTVLEKATFWLREGLCGNVGSQLIRFTILSGGGWDLGEVRT